MSGFKAGYQGTTNPGRASKLLRILSSGKDVLLDAPRKTTVSVKALAKRRKPGKKAL
jgi:hypothetical protein